MAAIEAEQLAGGNRISQVKFVRAADVAFRADAKHVTFGPVYMKTRIERLGENLIERTAQNLAWRLAIDRNILKPVGNPHVRHARRAQRAAKRLADLATGNSVIDPEPPYALIAASQRKAAVGLCM